MRIVEYGGRSIFFFYKQKTAYEMRISDWSSDVCSSDLERGIWQRRYWEHLVRDEDDLQRHVDYIHFNPVKHGHVARAVDWPYSTLHRYVAKGWLAEDWGGVAESAIEVGERG